MKVFCLLKYNENESFLSSFSVLVMYKKNENEIYTSHIL